MIKKNILIIIIGLLCVSCGVKDKPEYKTQINNNKILHKV